MNNDIHDFKTLIDMVAHAVGKFEKYAKKVDIDWELIQNIRF